MNKFTPGPWEVVGHEYYPSIIVVKGPESPIAIVTSATDIDIASHVRRVSDASLIAASPDLLEALVLARRIIEEKGGDRGHGCIYSARELMPDEFNVIDAAIVRARGESQ
jgi:hypothetical protein